MAESSEDSKNLLRLEEEIEGNSIGTADFIFRKIGSAVPLKPSDPSFELETGPLQALAVSERFRILFLAHSDGFYVAKTKNVIELANKIKEHGKGSGSIQELSVVDVPIGRVSILALSTDSTILAACVGGHIHLFSVVSLLKKEKEPSFSCFLGESSHAKDFRWRKNEKNSFVVLSSHGKLYYGDLESPLKDAMESVDAVDWSVKGDYIVVAKDSTLRILSPDFKEQFRMLLLFQPWAIDTNCITKVDSIKWVRSDSIIIGCLQLTDDGEEEGYMVQVVTNKKHDTIEATSKPIAISFGELFPDLNHEIPFGTGAYLFTSYLERWELVLASNRKNTDQHIVMLWWSPNGNLKEVAAIEFKQDKDLPRIELPENGDDNLIVGFGVDKVSLYEKIDFLESGEKLKELSPYCVLLCLTSDGKLVMFHAARISDPSVLPIVPPGDITSVEGEFPALMSQEPTSDLGIETSLVVEKSSTTSKEVFDINNDYSIFKEKGPCVTEPRESINFPSLSGQISDSQANRCSLACDSDSKGSHLLVSSNKEPRYLRTIQKSEVDAESNVSPIGQGKDDSGTNLGYFGQQSSNLGQFPVIPPLLPNNGSTFRDASKTKKPSLTPKVVLDDKSRHAFDINIAHGILEESTEEVTETKESLKFPYVDHTFNSETREDDVVSIPSYKSHDSVLVSANKEPKSLRITQKSEVDAESHSSLKGHLHYTSDTNLGFSSQEISKLDQKPGKPPLTHGLTPAFRDVTKTEGQKQMSTTAAISVNESSSFRSLLSDTSSNMQKGSKDSLKGTEGNRGPAETMGPTKFHGVSSGSLSSGKLSDTRASSFGSVHTEEQQNIGTVAGKTTLVPSIQNSPYSFQTSGRNLSSKDPRVSLSPSVFFSGKPIQSEEQKTAITGARTSDYASSHSIPSSSQEESKPVKSHIFDGTPFLEKSRTQRSPVMLDSELQVSEMVKELGSLLLDIEGEGGFKDACTVFQKRSVLEIESGLENLSEKCRFWKNLEEERLGDIQDLLDKTMQVLARKIHVEGIVQQASNSQYWELWNCQKLSPEFELKRHQILKLNQNIVNQIIELERHFNALELNKFGDRGSVPMGHRAFHSSSESSRQTQSLYSLYNTMNSQLAAAEQLSECLSKQMAVLNIESPPVKKRGAAKALFESIGLTYDGDSFRSPDAKRADHTPDSIKKLPPSSFSVIKEHSRRNASDSLKGVEPETARRRRDSLDRSLARFEPQRTTVKRMSLEEHSKVSASKSIGIGKEMFNSPTGDGFSVSQRTDLMASSLPALPPTTNKNHPNTNQSNKVDIQGSATHASISPSVPLFKWAKDKVGASQPVGSVFPSLQQRVNTLPLSTEVVASLARTVHNNAEENMGSSQCSSTSESFVAQSSPSPVHNISIYERTSVIQAETPNESVPRVSSIALPTKPVSPRKTVHTKTQTSDFSNAKDGEFIQPAKTAGNINLGARTLESSFSTQQGHSSLLASQTNTPSRVQSGETTSSSSTLPSPLFFSPPFPSTFSSSASSPSSIPASASSSFSDSSSLAMPFGGSVPSKGIDKSVPPPTSTSLSTSFFPSSPSSFQLQKQHFLPPIPSPTENVVLHSPSQPEVRDVLSKLGPTQSASETSGSLSSESQPSSHTMNSNNFGASPSSPLNSQPEASSAASVMFPAQSTSTTEEKTQALDATVIEEDEMEEEASETTVLNLGVLGGFGLGSTPAPSAPKSNPFGVPFGAAAASPAGSPFALTVPSGELFRPASFSFSSSTSPQPSQPMSHGGFSGFGAGSTFTPSTGSGFGQPAQVGAGQKALGSVLGAFGQSRQLGPGLPGMGFASSTGFGGGGFSPAAMSGGFGSGAGFASASTGSGFAGASTGGGFAGAATGGGFAGIASAGGGFAGIASASGGFGAAAGGGLAGAPSGAPTGGYGAFSSSGGLSRPPALFTQMRR